MTRIVAGEAGGRTLRVPARGTRPTSQRVREALFSSLDHRGTLADARVLDLYAGSGALGLEAVSRGARGADLVERSPQAARVAAANARSTELGDRVRVHVADVDVHLRARRNARPLEGDVDLVFVDPPYDVDEGVLTEVLGLLAPWIGPEAVVVVERSSRSPEPSWPPFLGRTDHRVWGETVVWFAAAHVAEPDGGDSA